MNKKRIFEPVRLSCGDSIQLGPGGPQFDFDLDPRPAGMIKATRLADVASSSSSVAPTREAPRPMTGAGAPPPTSGVPVPTGGAPMATAAPGTVGKATVERMIGETKRQSQSQMFVVVVILLLVVAAAGGGVYYYLHTHPNTTVINNPPPPGPDTLTPTQIATANTEATVLFEVGWKLIDTESGRQLYQVVIPNSHEGKEIIANAGPVLPIFLSVGSALEPLLSTDDNGGKNIPVGGRHSGTGFVVTSDGFILTNRHVAAAWFTRYIWPTLAGIAIQADGDKIKLVPLIGRQMPAWVPAQAKLVTSKSLDLGTLRRVPDVVPRGKSIDGRNDYLDVTFARNRIRNQAKLVNYSDRQDVALVKVDIPQSLKKCELNDNYDTIKVGDAATSLGYPGVSEAVLGVVASHDVFNQGVSVKEIPDPTLSSGYIGRILRGAPGMEAAEYFAGDYYQLTINSTGAGNSGGPVFDDHGRVVAIFTLGRTLDVTVSGAIPIRYGMELMGVKPMQAK